ncbi:Ankyrin-2 [Colletotrichum sp. SAR11_240]|nr:Ankyrin-2 [Colletotrichum sp. SAR11_240]
MWISDPEFLGNFSNSARVWSYGYNSDPSVNMTPSSIAFHANELLAIIMAGYTVNGGGGPTIFIAHGLGGVIVKKAVILSLSCPEYFNIRDSISGIVFLDTIHHGTDSEGVLKAVKTIAALSLQKGSLKPSWDDTRQYADAVREVNTAFLDRLPTELEMLNFIATSLSGHALRQAEPWGSPQA